MLIKRTLEVDLFLYNPKVLCLHCELVILTSVCEGVMYRNTVQDDIYLIGMDHNPT